MRRFKDLLKNKFVWGPKDVEHEKKLKRETPQERSEKFIWLPDHVEHHEKDVKESLDEKFIIAPEVKGNYGKPHSIDHGDHSLSHPLDRPNAHTGHGLPDEGDESHEAFLAHHESLDSDEEEAVSHYKESGHKEINQYLRGAHKKFKAERKKHLKGLEQEHKQLKFKDDPEHHQHLKSLTKKDWSRKGHSDFEHDDEPDDDDYHEHDMDDKVHHLDNVTNHRTVEHHVVFRGGIPGDKTRYPIGHEYTDHGYSSTSFLRKKAINFAKTHNVGMGGSSYKYKAHIHVIHVPKGSRGHYLDVQGENGKHAYSSEKEFLLHRGTRFKVSHHSEDENNHYIHSRVVKQGIRHKFNFDSKQKKVGETPKDVHGLPGQHKFPFMKHHKRFK